MARGEEDLGRQMAGTEQEEEERCLRGQEMRARRREAERRCVAEVRADHLQSEHQARVRSRRNTLSSSSCKGFERT